MRIAVGIKEAMIAGVMAMTGETPKSPAINKAVEEFVWRRKAKEFGSLIRGAISIMAGKPIGVIRCQMAFPIGN